MDGLADLTIVIPTYGRPDYVRRQVEYWNGSHARIVIADGSPSPIRFASGPVPSNITYIHSDGDFHSRMLQLADEVSTKFVAVLGDDDFFSPDGLQACINRLGADATLVGCVGRSVRFFFQDGRVLAEQRDPDSTEFPPSVMSGLDRLYATYHPGKIGALFYGVYRTAQWVDVVKSAYSVRFGTGYIYDTVIRVLLTYRGPVGVEEVAMWFCGAENPPVRDAPGMNRNVGFVEWLSSDATRGEVSDCIRVMVDDLVALGQDEPHEIRSAVEFVVSELRNRYQKKAAIRARPTVRVRRFVVANSPQFLKRFGKRFMPTGLRRVLDWTMVPIAELVTKMEASGIQISANDVDTIINAVVGETQRVANHES